jgi:hypothetical protein
MLSSGHQESSTSIQPQSQSQSARRNRKIQRTLPQLKRNAACVQCRTRRVKCNGAKPHCSSCERSFQFLARTQPDRTRDEKGVLCVYEDGEDDDESDAEPLDDTLVNRPDKRKLSSQSVDAGNSSEVDISGTVRRLEAQARTCGDYCIPDMNSASTGYRFE